LQLPTLALFVHGKKEGTDRLVDAFVEALVAAESVVPPKAQIKKRILDLAERRKGCLLPAPSSTPTPAEDKEGITLYGSARWVVHAEAALKLGLEGQLPAIEYTPQKPKTAKRPLKLNKPLAAPAPAGEVVAAPSVAAAEESSPPRDLSESAQASLLQFIQAGREPEES
jgi:hypothetical protein